MDRHVAGCAGLDSSCQQLPNKFTTPSTPNHHTPKEEGHRNLHASLTSTHHPSKKCLDTLPSQPIPLLSKPPTPHTNQQHVRPLQVCPSPKSPTPPEYLSHTIRTYQNLTPNAKLGVGVGLLVWGVVGLRGSPTPPTHSLTHNPSSNHLPDLSDKIEAKLGYTATDADKAELEKMIPRVSSVPRGGSSSTGAGGGEKA